MLCAFGKDLWCVTGDCEGIERARGHVEEGVSGGPGGRDDNGVDYAAET
jgi:hypothetical protein